MRGQLGNIMSIMSVKHPFNQIWSMNLSSFRLWTYIAMTELTIHIFLIYTFCYGNHECSVNVKFVNSVENDTSCWHVVVCLTTF